jgi:PAS domain S-box-containing protein/putative nucleotidyltransferase with HDIG domain
MHWQEGENMLHFISENQALKVYETLFLDSPDAIALCDMNQIVVKINPAFKQLFGFTESEAIGRPLDTLITPTPEMKAESDRLTSRIMIKEKVFTQTTRARKDGTLVPVSILGLTYRISEDESLMFWNYRDLSALVSVRKRADEIERRFKVIFQNSPYPIFALDKHARLSYMNSAMDDLFDLPGYKLVGLPLSEIAGPEEREEAVLKFRECAKGKIVSIECNCVDAKGAKRNGVVRGFPIQDKEGQFDGVICFLEDVTERKQAEKQLLLERNKYKALFEFDPIPRFLIDSSRLKNLIDDLMKRGINDLKAYAESHPGFLEECYNLLEIVDINMSALKQFAIPEKNACLGTMASVLSQKNHNPEKMLHIITAISEELEQFSYEDQKYPKSPEKARPFHLLLTWTRTRWDESRSAFFYYLSTLDITAVKDAQLQAEEKEYRYRILFENAQEGILAVDEHAMIMIANPAMEKMLGAKPHGLEGKSLFDLIEPGMISLAKNSFEKGKQGNSDMLELNLLREDGSSIPTYVKATPVLDSEGKFLAGVGLFEDLGPIKQAERAIRNQSATLRRILHQTIRALSATIESRDPYTAGHQRRVQSLALAISRKMRLAPEKRAGLSVAALVHDIGKITIPAEILAKPNLLSPSEMLLIQTHPKVGFEILKKIDFPWPVAEIVYQHHEACDGSGYPQRLFGDQILLEAKILSVADMIEATSSDRPYRPAMGIDHALEQLIALRGTKYDPEVVDICLEVFEKGFRWKNRVSGSGY